MRQEVRDEVNSNNEVEAQRKMRHRKRLTAVSRESVVCWEEMANVKVVGARKEGDLLGKRVESKTKLVGVGVTVSAAYI